MYVRNTAGFDITVKYRNTNIKIPYDGKIYSIPDDANTFGYCTIIKPFNIKNQNVEYVNRDGGISDIDGHKRRGRKENPPRDPDKPLKGVSIPKKRRNEILGIEEEVKEKPKKKRGRPRTRPLPDPNAPKKKRGRPPKKKEPNTIEEDIMIPVHSVSGVCED